MNQKTKERWAVVGFFTIIAIVGLLTLVFSAKRDQALLEWGQKYEECVDREYRTTPWEYYNEHGQYPECPVTE